MSTTDGRQRWTRRAQDAATEAILAGASEEEILAAVRAGLAEGQRVAAVRRGDTPAAGRHSRTERTRPAVQPGSAMDQLLRATGVTV